MEQGGPIRFTPTCGKALDRGSLSPVSFGLESTAFLVDPVEGQARVILGARGWRRGSLRELPLSDLADQVKLALDGAFGDVILRALADKPS